MKKRNKTLILFGVALIIIALTVFLTTMSITGEIKPEYFTSTPAIASYILITFGDIAICYVLAADWIKRLWKSYSEIERYY